MDNVYCEACCGGANKWDAMFLCQSLLLSIIVLNDTEILAMFLNDKSRDFRF